MLSYKLNKKTRLLKYYVDRRRKTLIAASTTFITKMWMCQGLLSDELALGRNTVKRSFINSQNSSKFK